MIETLINWMNEVRVMLIVVIVLVAGGMLIMAWVKTRSAAAVAGVGVTGVLAIVLIANMTTFASWVGADLNKEKADGIEEVCTEWGSCAPNIGS